MTPKEWWQATLKVGVPTGLLAFLVFWLTGDFNVRLKAIEQQHTSMTAHAERTEDLMGSNFMATERVFHMLQVMCVNDAKTADARRLCLKDP